MQLDSKNKCIPPDYYTGFDTFMIYSFYQVAGSDGFMKPLRKNFVIDYSSDFPRVNGFFSYIWFKAKIFISVFSELALLICMVFAFSAIF